MSSGAPENPVNNDGHGTEYLSAFDEFAGSKTTPLTPEKTEAAPAEETPEPEAGAAQEAAPAAEASPVEEPAAAEEAAAEEQAPAADDPWKDAPAHLKALYEQTQKERDQALHRAKSDANRVQALSRKLSSLSATVAPSKKEGEAEQADPLEATVAKLEKDFPEVGAAVRQIVEAQKAAMEPVKETISALAESTETEAKAAQVALLAERHPDFKEVGSSESWAGWLKAQPETIQRLGTSWDASEVSAALDLYKAQRAAAMSAQPTPAPAPAAAGKAAATDAKRSQQLEGGKDVGSRPAPAASGAPDDFVAAFEHYAQKRAQQAQFGRR